MCIGQGSIANESVKLDERETTQWFARRPDNRSQIANM